MFAIPPRRFGTAESVVTGSAGERLPSSPSARQELGIEGLFQSVGAGPGKAAERQPGLGARPLAGVGVGAREHLGRVRAEARAVLEVVAQTLPVLDDRAAPDAGALLGSSSCLRRWVSRTTRSFLIA